MDMMSQMLNQMQTIVNTQTSDRPAANRNRSESGNDFDSLVRKKQEAAQAGESAGNENRNGKSAAQGSSDTNAKDTEAVKPEQGPAKEEPLVTDDAYMMAAAMLLQAQFVPMNDESPTAPAEVTAFAEVTESAQSELLLAADGPDVPAVQFVPKAYAEQPQQQTAGKEETQVSQPEEFSAVKMSDTTEADLAPEFQQMTRQLADKLTDSVVQQFTQRADEEDDEKLTLFESTQTGTPVFEPMSAIPVKVAEPSTPVPLEAEDGIDQMGARLESLLTNENGDQTVELTLTPAELGTVRVSITHSLDGALHIEMSAANARAMNLLERGVASLQNQLMANSRPAVEIEVRGAENAQEQYLNPNDQQRNQQQQQNQQRRQDQEQNGQAEDFLAKLRLEAL